MANQPIKPIMLLILDGFGIAPPSNSNAVSLGKNRFWIISLPIIQL
jgi:bisphosphoglycerate-independent phosphoglycerate mutase (AlkP superfamily)